MCGVGALSWHVQPATQPYMVSLLEKYEEILDWLCFYKLQDLSLYVCVCVIWHLILINQSFHTITISFRFVSAKERSKNLIVSLHYLRSFNFHNPLWTIWKDLTSLNVKNLDFSMLYWVTNCPKNLQATQTLNVSIIDLIACNKWETVCMTIKFC